MSSNPPSPVRPFQPAEFLELDHALKFEEEAVLFTALRDYYPVRIGEVFRSRYQVVSKLGFGTKSTAWLCRDLSNHNYLTLKVCCRTHDHLRQEHHQSYREIAVSKHLDNTPLEHAGKGLVRKLLDHFEIAGPNGNHFCLTYQPQGMSWSTLLELLPEGRFEKPLVQGNLQILLVAVDYLHNCGVIHTDISPNNVLQGIHDKSILDRVEQEELEQPIPRKSLAGHTIYLSRQFPVTWGNPVLCDFGEARIGDGKHSGDIMPGIYRAPEVILGMEWDCKVDVWAIGIMAWSIAEGNNLFHGLRDNLLDDERHLAEMVSLMGPPPEEFLQRSEKCGQYWDAQGNWKGAIPIPDQSFESRERWLEDEDRALFLELLRSTLRWLPEERPTAEELVYSDFLMQPRNRNQITEASR